MAPISFTVNENGSTSTRPDAGSEKGGGMAKVTQPIWTSRGPTGKRVRHTAWGYTLRANGKEERKFSSAGLTEADAPTASEEV